MPFAMSPTWLIWTGLLDFHFRWFWYQSWMFSSSQLLDTLRLCLSKWSVFFDMTWIFFTNHHMPQISIFWTWGGQNFFCSSKSSRYLFSILCIQKSPRFSLTFSKRLNCSLIQSCLPFQISLLIWSLFTFWRVIFISSRCLYFLTIH